jgi:carotenoid 1,2-hydratase
VIAFIGSVFSPYYHWSGRGRPENHCAINVAVYTPNGGRWAMTERGARALTRSATRLEIGPSRLVRTPGELRVEIDEITAPIPGRLRGTVRLSPQVKHATAYALDAAGRHIWRPLWPRASVEVDLEGFGETWSGDGYFDTNFGTEPLEDAFSDWDWCRSHTDAGTSLFYDVREKDGRCGHLALQIAPDGAARRIAPPPPRSLSSTLWQVPRWVRNDAEAPLKVRQTLEDTPFYTRTALDGWVGGHPVTTVHESLSASRLRSPVVKAMLPFRMPRALF